MTELLQFARFYYFPEWLWLAFAIFSVGALNRICGLKIFNALFPSQVILILNSIPIIAGSFDRILPVWRVTHFFVVESVFLIVVCIIYAYILRTYKGSWSAISHFFAGKSAYLFLALGVFFAIFSFVFAADEGTSRIYFQTNYWYSAIKPIFAIFSPISYFAVVVLLVQGRRTFAYGLLAINVVAGILAGSKGAFVIQTATALLLMRDLGVDRKMRIGRIDMAIAAGGLVLGVALSLQRLRLTSADLWDRIMLFGEPTLLTYFAPDPTAACNNLTLLAKMHRGWARAIGDPTALDIDTLFGYAWTIQYVGVNTFTGPNARYSAYMICNFPGSQIFFGIVMTALYLLLMIGAVRLATRQNRLAWLILPFCVFSLGQDGQDFNLLMQDINLLLLLVMVLLFLPRTGGKRPAVTYVAGAVGS